MQLQGLMLYPGWEDNEALIKETICLCDMYCVSYPFFHITFQIKLYLFIYYLLIGSKFTVKAWLWCSSVLLKTYNKNWAWLLKKATLACCSMRRSAELSFRFCDYFFHSKLHNSKTTHMPPQFKSGYDLVLVEMTGNILVWTFQNVRHKQQIFMSENFIFEFIEKTF